MAKRKAALKGGASKGALVATGNGGGEVMDGETGEVVHTPGISTASPTVEFGGRTISLKKIVNRVLLRHADGATVYFTVESKIYVGKDIKGSQMAPADMVRVTDLSDGNEKEYIVNAVLKGLWEDDYPKDGFVGKSFAVYKEGKAPGKRYSNISLAEVSVKG